jgi:excinuclease UvrABC nuclease subunit
MPENQLTELYRHFGEDGSLLYVGVSLSTLQRLGQHKDHSTWFKKIRRVEIQQFDSREAALAAEREAILAEKPYYNIHHKAKTQLVLPTNQETSRDDLYRMVRFDPIYRAPRKIPLAKSPRI